MASIITGKVRDTPPNLVNGMPRYEIWFSLKDGDAIPHEEGKRVNVKLLVGKNTFKAGIRRSKATPYIWMCPDIYDEIGDKYPLTKILVEAGFSKNDDIDFVFDGHNATVVNIGEKNISSRVLLKSVGTSQHTDGVRVNKEFHDIFNPPASQFYVSKGKTRKVKVDFNGKSFKAEYRYEGTKASNADLQRIGFNKDLKDEFKAVFPLAKGFFNIRLGSDLNHFIFSYESVDETTYITELVDEIQKSRHGTREERLKRLASAPAKPETIQVVAVAHKRNADVIVEVLYRAKGKCEKCSADAPFLRKLNGSPYLEVHHVIPLSAGGDDTVENAIACCPNCHRKLHFG